MALGWELYERTHSALALGLVGLATALPVVILALPAGHLADTVERKRILIWAQVAFIVTGLGLAAVSYWRGPVALVYVILLARGAVQAYNNPARQALLPQLVPPELFGNAVTWGSSAFQIASVVGPGLGAWLEAARSAFKNGDSTFAERHAMPSLERFRVHYGHLAPWPDGGPWRAGGPLAGRAQACGDRGSWPHYCPGS